MKPLVAIDRFPWLCSKIWLGAYFVPTEGPVSLWGGFRFEEKSIEALIACAHSYTHDRDNIRCVYDVSLCARTLIAQKSDLGNLGAVAEEDAEQPRVQTAVGSQCRSGFFIHEWNFHS